VNRERSIGLRLSLAVGALTFWACSAGDEKVKAVDWGRVPVTIELRLARGGPSPQTVPAVLYRQSDTVYLQPHVQLSNSDIARVEAIKTRIGNGLVLDVWLTKAGAARMAQVTAQHIGDTLAVVVDSAVVSAPTIHSILDVGTSQPMSIGVPLGAEDVGRLAQAVAKTWPPVRRKGAR
jgi:preprotein translocase subunit SecD